MFYLPLFYKYKNWLALHEGISENVSSVHSFDLNRYAHWVKNMSLFLIISLIIDKYDYIFLFISLHNIDKDIDHQISGL